ncbi:transposase [Streptomyces sp. NBC_01242]|uniref:RNA-guided endonuclease InsQ/TnpB family protein n=1 Tax=unclassified Streptomyces TaxID=2593676 RepID=UPI002259004B|nr:MULTISPECIES: transposase [unclassified Streptomyces]MCX4796078.1 transposase [Streptomyces sp. NBC_01242]WSJ41067.1 transposase [Streptomyces sp. NBC_01321]WSP60118.1 transposase [Streptomyces sp. NBC_01241]
MSHAEVLKTDDQAHAARTLWNLLHAWWQMLPKEKRTLANADAAIRQAREDIDFLAVLPAQAAQAVLKTYVRAWKNCWEGRADAPNFKGRLRTVMSVDIPQGRDLNITRVHRRWGQVNLPKVGRVRFRWTKDLPVGKHATTENRITGARLVKDVLGWHITFRVQTLEAGPEPHQGPEVGIDVGVNVPIALSDGQTYEHGEWLTEKEKAKLLHLDQRAARRKQHRKPGERTSRRLHRTYDQIAGLRAKAKRRALDWQHRTTTAIARTYGTVVVEALTITNMVKSARGTIEEPGKNVAQKSGLNRSISGEAWGRTVTMLTYKTARLGGTLHKVPAPGTSQRCSACGITTPGSRESQAVFVCKNPDCGWSGNADHNAACNVLHLYRMGLALIPAAGRAVVRRAQRVKPATAR